MPATTTTLARLVATRSWRADRKMHRDLLEAEDLPPSAPETLRVSQELFRAAATGVERSFRARRFEALVEDVG